MTFRGKWFIAFGVFLVVCGIAGFLSNPSAAKTALISGGTFGVMSAAWGFLMLRGCGWARFAALASTVVLVGAFSWRASAGWLAVAAGEPKHFAAGLISLMLVGSIASLLVLLRQKRGGSNEWR
jgi:uncharacterized membrane protein (UPF0136 family)